MKDEFGGWLQSELQNLRERGLFKAERIMTSPQQAVIETDTGARVVNFCANNYLGLADHPALLAAARDGLETHGFGMASVRFICGTQDSHKTLESEISRFLGTEDTILYSSCFDANGGLFETLLGPQDAIISDALNHASVIDGIRLCKARRLRYANNDMADLERQLRSAGDCRYRLIATDGVFSMDGIIASLDQIFELADRYDAMVMVDDSHAVGVIGPHGAGTHDYHGIGPRADLILTGTLGKALGGASGGYTSGPQPVIDWLRQRSRPYLFSNSLAPPIVSASIKVLEMLADGGELRARLHDNSRQFRQRMEALGFRLAGADHPIIPVMIGDAALAAEMADRMLAEGIYVIGFSYPVVPDGEARIRTQMSAAHQPEHLDLAIGGFEKVGRQLGII